jgi:hypothetical protein
MVPFLDMEIIIGSIIVEDITKLEMAKIKTTLQLSNYQG